MKPLIILLVVLVVCLPLPLRAQRDPFEPITAANAHRLTQLEPIGYGNVNELRFSPDGRWLAALTPIGVVLLDTAAPDAAPVLLRTLEQAEAFAFSPDGRLIALAGCRGRIGESDLSYILETSCRQHETHLWALDQLPMDTTPIQVIDNGEGRIRKLVIGISSEWQRPLIVALRRDGQAQITSGVRSALISLTPDGDVLDVALGPDGRQIALTQRYRGLRTSATAAESICVWLDMDQLMAGEVHTYNWLSLPEPISLTSLRFSEDGQMLFARAEYGLVRVDMTNLENDLTYEPRLVVPENAGFRSPRLTEDLAHAVSHTDEGFYLWPDAADSVSGDLSRGISVKHPDLFSDFVGFSPMGHYAVFSDQSRSTWEDIAEPEARLRLLDTTTGASAFEFVSAVDTFAFSADETRFAYVDMNQVLHVADLQTGREIATLSGFARATNGVFVLPDGRLVYESCALDTTVSEGFFCGPYTLHIGAETYPDGFHPIAASSDGRLLARHNATYDSATGRLNTIQLLDTLTGRITREITMPPSLTDPYLGAFSPDNRWFAISGEPAYLVPLDQPADDMVTLAQPEGVEPSWAPAINYSPDGRLVITSRFDSTARLWDAQTGQQLAVVRTTVHPDSIYFTGDGAVFSPDGSHFAFGVCSYAFASYGYCETHQVYLCPVEPALAQGEADAETLCLALEPNAGTVVRLVFSPDGSLLVGSTHPHGQETAPGDEIKLWDTATGELLALLNAFGATEIAFSPDGRILYSNSMDGVIYRWGVPATNAVADGG